MDRENRILVLCANYYNEDITLSFIREILTQNDSEAVDIFVVDNSHAEVYSKKLAEIEKYNFNVRILYPPNNMGYLGAARFGLKEYTQQYEIPEWVIVSNTDISFPNKDFFRKLLELYTDENPPAVIGPSIFSTLTKINQNPQIIKRPKNNQMRLYTYIFKFYTIFQIYSLLSFLKNKIKGNLLTPYLKRDNCKPMCIYAPHGSIFILNKKYFNGGGNLEHGGFVFGETITIAEKARVKKMKVIFEPRLRVLHDEHSTTGKIKSREIVRYQLESAKYIYRTYFNNL